MRHVFAAASLALAISAMAMPAYAQSTTKTTVAKHDGLVLRLAVQVDGSTVHARAKVTNTTQEAVEYRGGCVPPFLQIQAHDTEGALVYGYKPPQISCFAIAIRELQPGETVKTTATFTIGGPIKVRALVATQQGTGKIFATHPIRVSPQ